MNLHFWLHAFGCHMNAPYAQLANDDLMSKKAARQRLGRDDHGKDG
jgi:hypothetical protein